MMLRPHRKAQGQRITRAPFDEHSAAAIYHVLQRQFAHWRKRLLHNLHNEWAKRDIAKAADDGALWMWVDDLIDDAIDQPSDTTMRDVASAMSQAHSGAANHVVRQIDVTDPLAISRRSATEATNFAARRAAEMIGQVSDTTRRVLRKEITDAVGLHQGVDLLADHIADTGLFSDARAEMIARTEISMAENEGTLEAGRQAKAAGVPLRKQWVLADNPCPLCQEAAALGVIDLDRDFGAAGSSPPPLHPNCMCAIDLVALDEEARKRASEADMSNDDDDDDTANGGNGDRHAVDVLADLLVEAGSPDGPVDRQTVLQWLLHSRRGQALVTRMARHRKRASNRKDSGMTRTETLCRIVKQAGGLGQLCQKIVKRGTADVTEAELTGMITAAAKHEYPQLDDAQAFTRLYASPNGEVLRRALAVAKAMPSPPVVGGDDATDVDDPAKALAQLKEMVAELRRHARNLSESAAWDRVMRERPSLAKRAFAA